MLTEFWVDRGDYHHTKLVRGAIPKPGDGEILVAIDKFAMTANNVTYAASGDLFGYWQFYPTGEDPWGKVTVWGIGEVVASHAEGIAIGERLYGFFPMASHVVMQPGELSERGLPTRCPIAASSLVSTIITRGRNLRPGSFSSLRTSAAFFPLVYDWLRHC